METGAVAYGVIVGLAEGQTGYKLDQATRDLIGNLERSNPGMQLSANPQAIQVDGVRGRSADLTGVSPVRENGRALVERDWLVALSRPRGGFAYLIFIAPQNRFDQLRHTYRIMLSSLRLK